MYKIKMALMRFMSGRYGNDALGKAIFWAYIILFIANLFIGSVIIYVLDIILVFLYFFRVLSRNIPKRQSENQKYLLIRNKITQFFKRTKNRFRDRKTHVYKKCPNCKVYLRLPKRKGTHICSCPKCKTDFKIKI